VRYALQLTQCQNYIHLPTDGGIFISQTVVQPNKTLTIRCSLPQQTALPSSQPFVNFCYDASLPKGIHWKQSLCHSSLAHRILYFGACPVCIKLERGMLVVIWVMLALNG